MHSLTRSSASHQFRSLTHHQMQRLPINGHFAPGRPMLPGPRHHEIQAGMIDILHSIEVDMQIGAAWDGLDGLGELRQANECRSPE